MEYKDEMNKKIYLFILIMLVAFSYSFSQYDMDFHIIVPTVIEESGLKQYDASSQDQKAGDENISNAGGGTHESNENEGETESNSGTSSSTESSEPAVDFGVGASSLITPNISVFNFPVILRFNRFNFKVNTPFVERRETFEGKKYKKNGLGDISASITYKSYTHKKKKFLADWEDYKKIRRHSSQNGNYSIVWRELEDIDYYFCVFADNPKFENFQKHAIRNNNRYLVQNQQSGVYYYRIYAVFNDGEQIESDIHVVDVNRNKIRSIVRVGTQLPTGKIHNVGDKGYIIPLGSGTVNYFANLSFTRPMGQWLLFSNIGYNYSGIYSFKEFMENESFNYQSLTENEDIDGSLIIFSLGTNYYGIRRFPLGVSMHCTYNMEGYTKYTKTETYAGTQTVTSGQYDNFDDFITVDLMTNVMYNLFGLFNLELKIIFPVYSKFNNLNSSVPDRKIAVGFGFHYN